jgi:hypothetical protein
MSASYGSSGDGLASLSYTVCRTFDPLSVHRHPTQCTDSEITYYSIESQWASTKYPISTRFHIPHPCQTHLIAQNGYTNLALVVDTRVIHLRLERQLPITNHQPVSHASPKPHKKRVSQPTEGALNGNSSGNSIFTLNVPFEYGLSG